MVYRPDEYRPPPTRGAPLNFESIESFYANDERRRASRELDYGVWWRSAEGIWRATWVAATGEFYVIKLHETRGRLTDDIGFIGVDVMQGSRVVVLTTIREEAEVERKLKGWADVCGAPDSLSWLVLRLTG